MYKCRKGSGDYLTTTQINVNGRFLFKFQSAVRLFSKFDDHLTTT